MNETVTDCLKRSRRELDAIFTTASIGAPMRGAMSGTIILGVPCLAYPVAMLMRVLWTGKHFSGGERPLEGTVTNRVSPFGIEAGRGSFRPTTSWLDGKAAIVIDYSRSVFLTRGVRDELREIEPGIFMGKLWWRRMRLCDFALVGSQGGVR